jgi:hypothetical protein
MPSAIESDECWRCQDFVWAGFDGFFRVNRISSLKIV